MATRKKSWIARVGVITVVAVLAAMVAPGCRTRSSLGPRPQRRHDHRRGHRDRRAVRSGRLHRRAGPVQACERRQRGQGHQDRLQGVRRRPAGPGEVAHRVTAPRHPGRRVRDRSRPVGHERRCVPEPAARALLRLGVRRHVLQPEAHRPSLYGFGFNGCLVPAKPKRMPGIGANQLYDIVSKKTGKKNPTRRRLLHRHAGGSRLHRVPGFLVRGCGLQGRLLEGRDPAAAGGRLHALCAGSDHLRLAARRPTRWCASPRSNASTCGRRSRPVATPARSCRRCTTRRW